MPLLFRHLLSDGLTEHPHLPPEMIGEVHLRQIRLPKNCLISLLNTAEPFQLMRSHQELSLSHVPGTKNTSEDGQQLAMSLATKPRVFQYEMLSTYKEVLALPSSSNRTLGGNSTLPPCAFALQCTAGHLLQRRMWHADNCVFQNDCPFWGERGKEEGGVVK